VNSICKHNHKEKKKEEDGFNVFTIVNIIRSQTKSYGCFEKETNKILQFLDTNFNRIYDITDVNQCYYRIYTRKSSQEHTQEMQFQLHQQ